jgi:hypothetical protein
MKKNSVRLSAEARKRDLLLASVLHAIGDKKAPGAEADIEKAKNHISDLNRIIGRDLAALDLAGLENDSVTIDQSGGALVRSSPRGVSTFRRRLGYKLCWTIPLIPIVAYHNDPKILKDLLGTCNLDIMKDLTKDLAANLDPSKLQEPLIQMLGLAMATVRKR